MLRLGAIVRLLMLAACLLPFASARQAAAALAPVVPLAPVAPPGESPPPPSEEDDERETDAKERPSAQAKHRPPVRELIDRLPPAHAARPTSAPRIRTTPPVAADPFRNGLGSPYRC